MDEQLKFIIEQLEKHEINYWVDSGTLLGLVRDGKLIKGDNDIDISVWDTEIEKIQEFANKLKLQSYEARMCYYKKTPVKIKINKKGQERVIDINFFRKINGFAWCIQPIIKTEKSITQLFVSKYILPIYKKSPVSLYSEFPYIYVLRFGCWWVPLKYFEKTDFIEIDGVKIKVPFMKEEYLEKRYGNWKVRNPKWNFVRDDGLLLQKIPDEVVEKYFKS
jgi:phosphorylcholine metabolism protein LicD